MSPQGELYKCSMDQHVQAFITTLFFMLNNKYDAWQLDNVLQLSCATNPRIKCNTSAQAAVKQYSIDFLAAFAPVAVPTANHGANGAMITSCICHGCPWSSLVLEGKNTYTHVHEWYQASIANKIRDDGNSFCVCRFAASEQQRHAAIQVV